jgi:hypothetical protein
MPDNSCNWLIEEALHESCTESPLTSREVVYEQELTDSPSPLEA